MARPRVRLGWGCWSCLGGAGDARTDADYLAEKTIGLRIFEDDDGKMNLSVAEVGGCDAGGSRSSHSRRRARGKRPSFDRAAPRCRRESSTNILWSEFAAAALRCEMGRFQETMRVELVNEGRLRSCWTPAKVF